MKGGAGVAGQVVNTTVVVITFIVFVAIVICGQRGESEEMGEREGAGHLKMGEGLRGHYGQ